VSTKRQQVVEALQVAMQTVPGIAAGKVHIWKDPEDLQTADMPCIIIRDGRADVSRETLDGGYLHRLQVEISIWYTGTTAWQQAQDGAQAMLTAYLASSTLQNLLLTDTLTAHEIGVSRYGSIMAAGQVDLTLGYIADAGTI